ncbi:MULTISPECIES: GIY-YIG nuclease family protein [Catenuloplanes]|uniref:GIY-YIG domain-containing protein n=1 Tax=Catenuloplanes niger TaxID=587534 RepID=A0AAE3ZUV2_9ACTN|nr:hypothetical protein [Catenuloplanes niger]MDR7324608.1 hypothetical protein [Catenuloplanes niger]
MIYAIPEGSGWLYVGQTRQPLGSRLAQHFRESGKSKRWANVMTLHLGSAATDAQLDTLEGTGRMVLRPATGRRWPIRFEINVST